MSYKSSFVAGVSGALKFGHGKCARTSIKTRRAECRGRRAEAGWVLGAANPHQLEDLGAL